MSVRHRTARHVPHGRGVVDIPPRVGNRPFSLGKRPVALEIARLLGVVRPVQRKIRRLARRLRLDPEEILFPRCSELEAHRYRVVFADLRPRLRRPPLVPQRLGPSH